MTKSLIKDLRGGWYDAGDFNKYTTWTARYIIVLLHAFEEHPQAFSDDYGIPESGNGIPDILDEVKWGLDWLVRMQNADGSFLCVQGLASASPPSQRQRSQLLRSCDHVRDPDGCGGLCLRLQVLCVSAGAGISRRYGDDLKKRATAAWTWAVANPNVLYYNNDELKAAGLAGALRPDSRK